VVVHAPADAVARLDDRDRPAGPRDLARRDQSGEAGADYDDVLPAADAAARLLALGGRGGVARPGGRPARSGRRRRVRDEPPPADLSLVDRVSVALAPPMSSANRPPGPSPIPRQRNSAPLTDVEVA
jgi:hypothetical protein